MKKEIQLEIGKNLEEAVLSKKKLTCQRKEKLP